MKYDTQSGLFVTVFWASVCSTTLTWPPLAEGGAFSTGGLEPMKWMATKATPATTAANAISSVVTRAGSDTGYHLVSLRHAMHTVAATAWPGPDRPGPTGKFEAKSAGTMPSYAPDGDGGTNRDATAQAMNDKIVIYSHNRTQSVPAPAGTDGVRPRPATRGHVRLARGYVVK